MPTSDLYSAASVAGRSSESGEDEGRKPEVGGGIFASISEYRSTNKVACLFSEKIVIDS